MLMIKPTPWFARTFQFGQLVEIFPVVFARLHGTPARAAHLIANLPECPLGSRLDGAWSVKENIGHLSDLQELDEKRLDDFLAGVPILSAADLQNRATEKANHNETPIGVLLEKLKSGRAGWLARISELQESDLRRKAVHPRLKQQMQLVDWLYFIAEHDDHHLARVFQLIELSALRPRATEV